MSWKTVLSDKAKFGDDKKVTIEGVEYTLGELRQINSANEGELARKMDEVAQQKQALAASQQEVTDFYRSVLRDKQTLEAQAAALPKPNAGFNPLDDPAWQPILKPLADRLEAIEKKQVAELYKKVDAIGQAALQMATAYQNDKFYTTYKSLLPNMKDANGQARYQLEDLRKKAEADKLIDPRTGILDLEAAYERLEEPRKLEAIRQKALEEGIEKGRTEALMGAMPRPGNGAFTGSALTDTRNGGKALSLDEAVAAAMKDQEILTGLQAGV